MTPRRTMLATEINDLQVQLVPRRRREQGLQIRLGTLDTVPIRQAPARRQPMDVRIDRKGRHPEGLRHQHRRRLVPDPRQRLQRLETRRHLALMALDQQLRHRLQVPRFRRRQPDLSNGFANHLDRQRRHRRRGRGRIEQRRRHLVDLLVGRLSRKHHGAQEGEVVPVIQGDRHGRVIRVERFANPFRLVLQLHAGSVRCGRRRTRIRPGPPRHPC